MANNKGNEFNTSYVGLRKELVSYIKGEQLSVLDVGCATGVNGKYLLDENLAKTVVGVEYDEKMAKIAASNYKKVFVGNLNVPDFVNTICNYTETYDYILLGDILEHLLDPLFVLRQLKKKLNPEGIIIISVPNIAHLELFIQVYLKGTFPKNNRGIFDKTHVSWFTKKDIQTLVNKAGFNTKKYIRVFRSRDAIGSKFNILTRVIRFFNKDWVTFQHILICEHE